MFVNGRKVSISAPDHLEWALISSETMETPVAAMIRDFEIELLDEYFSRRRSFRDKPRARKD